MALRQKSSIIRVEIFTWSRSKEGIGQKIYPSTILRVTSHCDISSFAVKTLWNFWPRFHYHIRNWFLHTFRNSSASTLCQFDIWALVAKHEGLQKLSNLTSTLSRKKKHDIWTVLDKKILRSWHHNSFIFSSKFQKYINILHSCRLVQSWLNSICIHRSQLPVCFSCAASERETSPTILAGGTQEYPEKWYDKNLMNSVVHERLRF